MKKYIFTLSFFIAAALHASDALTFDLRAETVVFNEVSYHLEDNQPPKLIERTIIGRFYQNELPEIMPKIAESNVNMTPYSVLSEMLALVQSKRYDELPRLYSVETRGQVSERLKDPEIGTHIKELLDSLKTLEVLGVWLESPNLLIAYVKVNGLDKSVRPYVFEFNNGWYLRAGHFDSQFSNQLDAFYTKNSNNDMTIVSPPSLGEMTRLFENTKLQSFVSDLGLDIL